LIATFWPTPMLAGTLILACSSGSAGALKSFSGMV
jgi:hypothetical protein